MTELPKKILVLRRRQTARFMDDSRSEETIEMRSFLQASLFRSSVALADDTPVVAPVLRWSNRNK